MKSPKLASPWTLVSALPFLFAACSNSDSSGLTPGAIDEQLTYDPSSFGFVDTHDPDFHPLGGDEFVATRREEVMMLLAGAEGEASIAAMYRDDAVVGGTFGDCGGDWLAADFAVSGTCVGDIDGDGRPEPIFAGVELDSYLRCAALRIGQPDPHCAPAGMDTVTKHHLAGDPWPGNLTGIQVVAIDLDGDGADELVTVEYWARYSNVRLRVLQPDTSPKGGLIFHQDHSFDLSAEGAWISGGQFDDDPAAELVLTLRREGGLPVSTTYLIDDLASNLRLLSVLRHGPSDRLATAPLVANFDLDELDEIVIEDGNWAVGGARATHLTLLDWNGTAAIPIAERTHVDHLPWTERLGQGMVASDRDLDGIHEVAWLGNRSFPADSAGLSMGYGLLPLDEDGGCYYTPCKVMVELRTWEPITGEIERIDMGTAQAFHGDPVTGDLSVLDECGSGHDAVLAAWKIGPSDQLKSACVADDDSVTPFEAILATAGSRPLIAAGDFDGDGLRLRYTGSKHLELPTPIPLALISAPPTKADVMQNHGATKSLYYNTDASEPVLELLPALSVSLAPDREVEDLFGVIEVDDCETLGAACVDHLASPCPIAASDAFTGTFDTDSIVFAGVLHQVYDYEVVGAPDLDAVGELFTVNVPVDVRIYRWGVEHFTEVMPPEYAIPDDLLLHELGDPASYPIREDLEHLLEDFGGDFEGWSGSHLVTHNGGGLETVRLSMSDALAGAPEHGFSVSASDDLLAVGPTMGRTVGLLQEDLYRVRLDQGAVFDGRIGALVSWDWLPWMYEVGIVVYERTAPDTPPFYVVDYWTDPKGTQY